MVTQTKAVVKVSVPSVQNTIRFVHDSRLGCTAAYAVLVNVQDNTFTVVGSMSFAHKRFSNRNGEGQKPDQFSRVMGRKIAGSRLSEYLRQLARGYGVRIPFFFSYKKTLTVDSSVKEISFAVTKTIDTAIKTAFDAIVARNRAYETDNTGNIVTDAYRKITRSEQVENGYVLQEVYSSISKELKNE